jgi:hypothetical protein
VCSQGHAPIWYTGGRVAKVLKEDIQQAESWPEEDQVELAEYAREIVARRTGVYHATADELRSIDGADRRALPKRVAMQHPVLLDFTGAPYGTRTRVTAVKGRRPRPLDEGR